MINIVHNADCLPAMREMKDNEFDLCICDPPYGIGDFTKVGDANFYKKRSEQKYGKAYWNNEIPTEEYFTELYRISKERIIWGSNYFKSFIKDTGVIVWDKINESSRWSKIEIASNSTSGINALFRFAWNGFIRDEPTVRIHPTQKPIALYKWLLKNYAKEGDTIFDSHVGSGSSRIACHEMGFDFTGYEIDKDYWLAQEKRFNIVKNQMRIL